MLFVLNGIEGVEKRGLKEGFERGLRVVIGYWRRGDFVWRA